jgi:DeoR family transcriptional regulator of aga operon
VVPAELRQERMLELLDGREFLPVREFSALLGVSEVTVRSDLAELAGRGAIRRVRGGALRRATAHAELAFEQASVEHAEEKAAIGAAAAALVRPEETILLDVGTTTTALARALRERPVQNVAVFTNSLNVALELEPAIPPLTVVVTGGTLRPLQHSLVDPLGAALLDHLHVDTLFLGCNGVDADGGITNVNLPEAEIKKRMLKAARKRVVLADGSKLGEIALARLCGIRDIDLLITGRSADPKVLAALRKRGLEVQVAP